MMNDVKQIEMDRMRFTKNKSSANLVLLAIVLDVLYFVSLYKSDVGNYYYNILIGASIIYNLIFLLAAFLASEAVKSRRSGFTVPLIVLGLIQFGRIFIIPFQAHSAMVSMSGAIVPVMGDAQFIAIVIFLVGSGACCIAAAVTSHLKNKALTEYMKTIAQPNA